MMRYEEPYSVDSLAHYLESAGRAEQLISQAADAELPALKVGNQFKAPDGTIFTVARVYAVQNGASELPVVTLFDPISDYGFEITLASLVKAYRPIPQSAEPIAAPPSNPPYVPPFARLTVVGFHVDSSQLYCEVFRADDPEAAIGAAHADGVAVCGVFHGSIRPADQLQKVAFPDEDVDRPASADCDFCHGKGWANVDEEVPGHDDSPWYQPEYIQKCDLCDCFPTDQDACQAASAAGWLLGDDGRVLGVVGLHPFPVPSTRTTRTS